MKHLKEKFQMKKTYRVKFTDGTPDSIITCEESSLERTTLSKPSFSCIDFAA